MKLCSICKEPYYAKGYCKKHYKRHLRIGSPHLPPRPETCYVEGCSRPARCIGLCQQHYAHKRRGHSKDKLKELKTKPHHGLVKEDGYAVWNTMQTGIRERGLDYYPAWSCPKAFCKWLKEQGYDCNKHRVERIDRFKGYTPDNYRIVEVKKKQKKKEVINDSLILLEKIENGDYTDRTVKDFKKILKDKVSKRMMPLSQMMALIDYVESLIEENGNNE